MRILFVARRYWPAIGGVESFLRQLARELATRHELTVIAHRIDNGPTDRLTDSLRPPPHFEPFDDGGVHVRPLRISPRDRLLLAPLVSQSFRASAVTPTGECASARPLFMRRSSPLPSPRLARRRRCFTCGEATSSRRRPSRQLGS